MEPFEKELRARGFRLIAGLDEAGRGPLAGPVVAAAVVLPEAGKLKGIDDSKKLSAGQRREVFSLLLRKASAIGLGLIEAQEIDRLNILRASLKAMEMAVGDLPITPDFLLIDGLHSISLPISQRAVPQGDRRCLSIAAASIVAKVTRDRLMEAYHDKYPEYNFAQHKGYGTKEHLQAIRKYGCCPIHRRSFKTIYQLSLL
ncbi:MAG: ribonuclease HII [Deltaproteobacteria bacterium]|nr:ribonuclease HII [Deltaproteobacteria bacterium]